jgi:hypothetical protein
MPTSKVCCHCKVDKNISLFNRDISVPDGRARICRPCRAKTRKEQIKKNPERYAKSRKDYDEKTKDFRKTYVFQRRHGITPEEVLNLVEEQGGCKICKATEPGGTGYWHVDHDHKCCGDRFSCDNCRRGILCNRCNLMLGMARDSKEILLLGSKYIEEYEERKYAESE